MVPGGVLGPRGCMVMGGAWSRGGHGLGGVVSQHALRQTPREQNYRQVKILPCPKLRLRVVIKMKDSCSL